MFATRLGEVALQDVLTKAGELERQIKDLLDDAPVPAEPARDELQAWMVGMYFENWKARQTRTSSFMEDINRPAPAQRAQP